MGQLNELHLFAGAGGGILAGELLGHKPVCAVEINEYCRRVLKQRQDDGILPGFPIWDDVCTFGGRPWRGRVDIVSGGFPCQDISSAGTGKGIDGAKSGLWSEMFRVVCEVLPSLVFVENVPMLTVRGLGRVLGDLAKVGFDAAWCVLGADDVGAPHARKRIWILAANADHAGQRVLPIDGEMASTPSMAGGSIRRSCAVWTSAPEPPRLDDGVANRVDRTRATGNGQVPAVAALAFRTLSTRLGLDL